MIETILTILVYVYQIFIVLLIASIIPFFVYFKQKKKKVFAILLLLCLCIELVSLGYLANNPIWICPTEYREFISAEKKASLIGCNSGIYSKQIPVIPICIVVKYADEDEVVVVTSCFAFGHTELESGPDGLSGGRLY